MPLAGYVKRRCELAQRLAAVYGAADRRGGPVLNARIRPTLACIVAAACVLAASSTSAGDDAVPTKTAAPTNAAAPAKPQRPPHRAVPDYEGREPEGTTAVDVVAWIPRAILFPVRIVVDYGVRRPLGWLVTKAEHSHGFRKFLRRMFREVENANPLIFPVALVDFGFKSSVGIRIVFRRGYLIPHSDVTLRAGTGGIDWYRAEVETKTKRGALRGRTFVGANKRPDYVFYGIGGDTPDSARARYTARKLIGSVSVGGALEGIGEATLMSAITNTTFDESTYDDDPSIEDQVAAGRIAGLPTGYPDGYSTARVGGKITLDTRFEGRRARSGARLDAMVERVVSLDDMGGAWTRVELMLGAGMLLDPVAERKLDVRLGVQFVESDGNRSDVPFLELATLTGTEWLRGTPAGRVFDVSAAAMIVDYHWPIAAWLDAHGHLGAGNVFGRGLGGFSLGALRGSIGGALTIAGLTDRQLGASVAFGTEPLGDGVDVTSVRFLLEYSSDY